MDSVSDNPTIPWQQTCSREDRIKVCQHMLGKLMNLFPGAPEVKIREKTSTFEAKAFADSRDWMDYLWRVANTLTNVENDVNLERHRTSLAESATSTPDWRDSLTAYCRIQVCQLILETLGKLCPGVPKQMVRDRTTNFEFKAFRESASRQDYLQRISTGLEAVKLAARKSRQHINRPDFSGSSAVSTWPSISGSSSAGICYDEKQHFP